MIVIDDTHTCVEDKSSAHKTAQHNLPILCGTFIRKGVWVWVGRHIYPHCSVVRIFTMVLCQSLQNRLNCGKLVEIWQTRIYFAGKWGNLGLKIKKNIHLFAWQGPTTVFASQMGDSQGKMWGNKDFFEQRRKNVGG